MCNPAAMMGIQAVGAIGQAYGANAAGQGQKAYYQYLAAQNLTQVPKVLNTANLNTETVVSASGREETNLNRGVSALEGSQKAGMAANGVWGGSKTASDVIGDTENKAALDRAAIRTNANLQTRSIAMGAQNEVAALKSQSNEYTMAGENAAAAGRINAATSILNGATAVAKNWYAYDMTKNAPKDPLADTYDDTAWLKSQWRPKSKLSLY